jgi:hypothetical protein
MGFSLTVADSVYRQASNWLKSHHHFCLEQAFMRLRAVLWGCLLLVVLVTCLHAADTLPAAITDTAFWKMITDFSEEGGRFDFEMYMSNEAGFQTVLPDLLSRVSPGGVYLGVAPEQNFTYIAALRPKMAIIDIRRENMVEMLMYKALFEMSPTRGEFVSRLFSVSMNPQSPQASVDTLFAALGRGNTQLFQQNLQAIKNHLQKTHGFALTPSDLRIIDRIAELFFRGGPDASLTTYGTSYRLLMLQTDGRGRNRNFLASETNYQFVRQMHQKNLIVPVVGDFAGSKALRAVASYIRDHNAQVTAFYVSNVEEYISSPRSVWTAYCRNLSLLPVGATSTFIRFGRSGRGSWIAAMPSFIRSC